MGKEVSVLMILLFYIQDVEICRGWSRSNTLISFNWARKATTVSRESFDITSAVSVSTRNKLPLMLQYNIGIRMKLTQKEV